MTRTWTEVGKDVVPEDRRAEVAAMIARIEWQSVPCELPACSGLALREAIQILRIPHVSHVGNSHEMAPFGLLAVRARYSNGAAEIFMVDMGATVVPICSDFEASA